MGERQAVLANAIMGKCRANPALNIERVGFTGAHECLSLLSLLEPVHAVLDGKQLLEKQAGGLVIPRRPLVHEPGFFTWFKVPLEMTKSGLGAEQLRGVIKYHEGTGTVEFDLSRILFLD